MYQDHQQQYATTPNNYLSHAGPSSAQQVQVMGNNNGGIAPLDTTHQLHPQPHQQQGTQHTPLVATGDWTKDLVHLAKTAELKKHALTLQLHTAHILSAHASLDAKGKAIQDIKEQKNKLESERTRLLNCLREINEDRDKADLLEAQMNKECIDLRGKISTLTDGEYAVAKADVDRLRLELGQPALPSLQSTLDEKSSQYLNERRLNGTSNLPHTTSTSSHNAHSNSISNANTNPKRSGTEVPLDGQATPSKRPRGRPKGSKNKNKEGGSGSGVGGP